MRIVALSDTHTHYDQIQTETADVLIHAGDLNVYYSDSLKKFCEWLDRQPARHKIVIAGNHDKFIEMQNDLSRKILEAHCIYLQDSGVEIDGIKFWGSPYTPTFFNWYFMRDRGPAIKKHWDAIPNDTDVLITHGPVFGIQDRVFFANGEVKGSVGCDDLLKRVKEIKPKVFICGHIHGNHGMVMRNGTLFINAALANHYNEIEYEPIIFDMPD